jgi:hypothetical protein
MFGYSKKHSRMSYINAGGFTMAKDMKIGLDRIFLTGVLADNLSDQLMRNASKFRHASAYKKASKEWGLCARNRARVMQGF